MTSRHLRKGAIGILLGLIAGLGFGCAAGKPMALSKAKSAADLVKPIGVFVLHTENRYKTNYQSDKIFFRTRSEPSGRSTMWRLKEPDLRGKDQFSEYLVSVQVEPGSCKVNRVMGEAGDGFLISGRFTIDPGLSFQVNGTGITYLGHVTFVNRERVEGEPRSGQVMPLIDQAVVGYSGGTTDIVIEDAQDADLAKMQKVYPVLQGVTVSKSIMTKTAPTR